jgi:acetyl esterase
MALDPQAAELIRRIEALPLPARGDMTVEQARQSAELYTEMMAPRYNVASVVDTVVSGPARAIPIRIYRPTNDALGVLVYFHGGGWTLGDLDTSDPNCRGLASVANCVVVSVDYRLAPEHRFPAAFEDGWAATVWAAENASALGSRTSRVAVGGESSGGNVAAAVALRARIDHNVDLALQLLIYPPLDFSFETKSYEECCEGFILTRKAMEWYWAQYLGDPAHGRNAYASPLRAEQLEGLAPALIFTAEYDPLRDEAEEYGARLVESGVSVEMVRCAGQIHGFFAFGRVTRDAHSATLERAAERLRCEFATPTSLQPG